MILVTGKTIEYSCRPWTRLDVDACSEDAIDGILDALLEDERALGVGGLGFDAETGEVSTIFQVAGPEPFTASDAGATAIAVFDAALEAAGVGRRAGGLSIVEGDDPERLP